MTTKQLNAAIKKFNNDIKVKKLDPHSEAAKNEFFKLYRADKEIKYMSFQSFKILFRLNMTYQWEKPYYFGSYIEI